MWNFLRALLDPSYAIRHLTLWCSDSPPPAPDPNPGMQAAAQASEKVGMRMADIAENTLEESKRQNSWMESILMPVIRQDMESQREQTALSREYDTYNKSYYRPLEQSLILDAIGQGYLSDQEMNELQSAFSTDYTDRMGRQGALDDANFRSGLDETQRQTEIGNLEKQIANLEKYQEAAPMGAQVQTAQPYQQVSREAPIYTPTGGLWTPPEGHEQELAGWMRAGLSEGQQAIQGAVVDPNAPKAPTKEEQLATLREKLAALQSGNTTATAEGQQQTEALRRQNFIAGSQGNDVVLQAIRTAQKRGMDEAGRQAAGNVRTGVSAQREQMTRYLSGLNVRPDAGRFAEINQQLSAAGAAQEAEAVNQARTQFRTGSRAERSDAVSMGKGLPGNQATSAQIALQAGSQAGGQAANLNSAQLQNNQAALPWFSGATGAYGTAGNIYGAEFNARNSAYQSALAQSSADTQGMYGAIGTGIGAIAVL